MLSPALIAQLSKQVGFIRRSCDIYDAGELDEAIRIATSIRVLMHDTRNSVSLLTQLGVRERVHLSSTIPMPGPPPEMPSGLKQVFGMPLGALEVGATGISHVPQLGGAPTRLVLAPEWWHEEVWILDPGTHITRKDLVRAAANNDGGTHVDEFSDAYKRLVEGPFDTLASLPRGNPGLRNTALSSLRELGHEILNSGELLALMS